MEVGGREALEPSFLLSLVGPVFPQRWVLTRHRRAGRGAQEETEQVPALERCRLGGAGVFGGAGGDLGRGR